jgi:hypothetical protein
LPLRETGLEQKPGFFQETRFLQHRDDTIPEGGVVQSWFNQHSFLVAVAAVLILAAIRGAMEFGRRICRRSARSVWGGLGLRLARPGEST